jgi:hypothetical protein
MVRMDLPISANLHHLSVRPWHLDYCFVVRCAVELVLPTESAFDERKLSEEKVSQLLPALLAPPDLKEKASFGRHSLLGARNSCFMKRDF